MSSQNDGTIIILSSPSGAGKTTLVKLLSEKKNFNISVSHTTREPRSNEKNGKDYFFVSHSVFKNLIKKNEFLEYAEVFNNFYGTTKKPVIDLLSLGKNVIFDIDWQGTRQIKTQNIKYKIITFFVLPPSKEVLFERLSNRDMKDKLIASERMKDFYKDVKHWIDYDFVVINDDLNKCYDEISRLIDLSLNNDKRTNYNKKIISDHVSKLIN
jgi:guanylate kinase